MRSTGLALALLLLPGSAFAQALSPLVPPVPAAPNIPSEAPRFEQFLDTAFRSPTPYVYAVGGALIDQVSGFPDEWTGASGIEKRHAAHFAQVVASDAIGHAAAAVMHHRVGYDACRCQGAWPRASHGVARAFVSVREDGGLAPNYSLWMAKFASAGLANAWYPDSYTRRDVVWQSVTAIGVSAGLNIVQEFAPELLRLVHLR